jgi:hypothetical protein
MPWRREISPVPAGMSAVRKTIQYVRDVTDKYWHVLVFELDVVGCLFSCGYADNILGVGMT